MNIYWPPLIWAAGLIVGLFLVSVYKALFGQSD